MIQIKETENDILETICSYLAWKKEFFFRVNNIPVKVDGVYRRMPKWSKLGVADVILVKDGKFIGLECKTSKGKLSSAQIQFRDDVRKANGLYYEIRSIEDLQKVGL